MNLEKELKQFIKLKERSYNTYIKYQTYYPHYKPKEPEILLVFEQIKEFLNDKYW